MNALGFQNYPAKQNEKCSVTGKIPVWLNGVLYRSGPGQFSANSISIKHWFDGLQRLHRFEISGASNSAFYTCKGNVPADTVTTNSIIFGRRDPCESAFGRYFQLFKSFAGNLVGARDASVSNVNVVPTTRLPGT